MAAVRLTMAEINRTARVNCKHGAGICQELGIEACVIDQASPGMPLVAGHLGLPFVHVAAALSMEFTSRTPLPLFGWSHGDTWLHRVRNYAGLTIFRRVLGPVIATAKEEALRLGVDVDWSDERSYLSKLAQITQVPKEFDLPNPDLPDCFHHTVRFHDGHGRMPADFPWDRLTGEPLIYASMGTMQKV